MSDKLQPIDRDTLGSAALSAVLRPCRRRILQPPAPGKTTKQAGPRRSPGSKYFSIPPAF